MTLAERLRRCCQDDEEVCGDKVREYDGKTHRKDIIWTLNAVHTEQDMPYE